MKTCTVCEKKHFALGYCRSHYTNFKRNGRPESLYDRSGYSKLGGVKDVGLGRRGSLAVNWINDIKFKARKRGKDWQLNHEQAFKLITSSCTYCGFKPNFPDSRVGIDRVDNSIGYIESNCAPCCSTCNSAKGSLSMSEFKEWVIKIYTKMIQS